MATMNYDQYMAYNCCYNKINCYIKCQRLQLAKREINLLKMLSATKKQKKLIEKLKFMPTVELQKVVSEIIEKEDGYILDILLKYVQ